MTYPWYVCVMAGESFSKCVCHTKNVTMALWMKLLLMHNKINIHRLSYSVHTFFWWYQHYRNCLRFTLTMPPSFSNLINQLQYNNNKTLRNRKLLSKAIAGICRLQLTWEWAVKLINSTGLCHSRSPSRLSPPSLKYRA